ncbi:MAG TPA: hypothetical protein VF435_05940, partial [Pyrinomonadaceae bacterium]
ASGRTTAKTNTPRRIIPMILRKFFASFIVSSPIAFASPLILGFIARSQLYADSHNRVPMKILNTLPAKMAIRPVACLILFGDNYTPVLTNGPLEFTKPFWREHS